MSCCVPHPMTARSRFDFPGNADHEENRWRQLRQRRPDTRWLPRSFGLILAALLWILSLPVNSAAAQKQQAPLPEGMEIKVKAEPERATVGDPVRIDFDILVPRGYQFQFPSLSGQFGDFTVLQTFPGPSLPDAESTSGTAQRNSAAPSSSLSPPHHHARIVVALYKPGEYMLPAVPLSLRDRSGKQVSIPSPTVKVRIESVLTGKAENLKDLKRQAEIPEPVRWQLWLGTLLLTLIVAGVVWWLWRRRRREALPLPSRPHMDPLQLAEAELRDLLGRGLLEKNLVKPFYVALADIIKRLLEAGYGIHTLEKTTAEIMDELRSGPPFSMPAAEFDQIESFLIGCDLVKFAKNIPAHGENDSSIKRAFEILEFCRRRRASPVLTNLTKAEGVHG